MRISVVGKSTKKVETANNFVPGWIGGRLTSPAAYDKSAMKMLQKRLAALAEAREAAKVFNRTDDCDTAPAKLQA
jgi:hypothetical protein